MSSLKKEMLASLKTYGRPMTYEAWTGPFFEDYSKFEINEALNQLVDDKTVIRRVDRKYIAESVMKEGEKKALVYLKENGPDKIGSVIDRVALDAKQAALYRDVMRRLLDSGRVEITIDWKVRAVS